MVELTKFTNGVIFWDVSFFRGVHTRELEAVLSFMDTIYGSSVKGFDEDKMGWKPNRNKGFMINDYYRLLVGSNDSCFPRKSIWKQNIPSQVAFFVSFLKVWILDWCYMCKCNGESVNHLFLHCLVAMDL